MAFQRLFALEYCRRVVWRFVAATGFVSAVAVGACADVIVLANRAREHIQTRITPVTSQPMDLAVRSGDTVPIFVDGRAYVQFQSRGVSKRYLLDANSAYYFGNLPDGSLDLQKIGLNDHASTADGRTLPGSARLAPPVTIPVKIFVDEEEPARQILWEPRLRKRVEKASEVLEKHCQLRLKVVALGTWDSDDRVTEFFDSFGEFETETTPFPGQLAIGFTSQYQVPHGRVHLGGTRGPFHTHILIREWSRHVGEPERLELLVHELGHFLGATHSPERNSVMRPILGDRQSIRANFTIRFDPVNTLIMAMIVEEVRRRHIREMRELSAGTKRRLQQIYGAMADSVPNDPAGKQYVNIVESATISPLLQGSKRVVQEIVRAARENHKLPVKPVDDAAQGSRLQGDALTEFYVRRAASAASSLPSDVSATSFLLGIGIGLDNTDTLRNLPKIKEFVGRVESSGQQSIRRAFLGELTMHNRADLAKHFAVSAYLAASEGSEAAESAGIAKEMLDSRRGGSGFSFADLAANKSGILFAERVINGTLTLEQLANGFHVTAHMPSVEGLPEGIHTGRLLAQFGKQSDSRFRQQLQEIEQRLQRLPPHQAITGP